MLCTPSQLSSTTTFPCSTGQDYAQYLHCPGRGWAFEGPMPTHASVTRASRLGCVLTHRDGLPAPPPATTTIIAFLYHGAYPYAFSLCACHAHRVVHHPRLRTGHCAHAHHYAPPTQRTHAPRDARATRARGAQHARCTVFPPRRS